MTDSSAVSFFSLRDDALESAERQHLTSPFELKFQATTGQFEGYASVFNVVDQAHDRVARGAFRRSLEEWRKKGGHPPLLWQHDVAQPIGAWREMREDAHGLYVRGDLFVEEIARAREAYKLMREGVVNGLSIGYRVRLSERDRKSGVRVLKDVDLLEVSMVTFPANDSARILRVKSALAAGGVPSEREFEALLRDAGLSRKQAKGILAGGYKALLSPGADVEDGREARAAHAACHDRPSDETAAARAVQALAARIRALS